MTRNPIKVENHWNCGVCGCSHDYKSQAENCDHRGMKHNPVVLEESSTCLIEKDELERLNKGLEAKIWVYGKELFVEVANR